MPPSEDVMTAYVRNRLAIALAAAVLLAAAGPAAWSQATGPIKIVVPYTPGSGPDILSRLMAEQIGRAQGPTVVVENRPGGGTVIGTEAVERVEHDGRTVLLVANSFVINPPLQRASYDPSTSFEPVCYLAATPMVLVVLGSSPYRAERFDHRGARQAGGTRLRERRTRLLPAYRHRGAQARGEHQHHLRALRRHGAGDQRAHGQSRGGGVGRLSHGGVAAQVRHAARARHHLARADRDAAGCADAGRDRRQQIRGGDLLRHRGAGEDADRGAQPAIRRLQQRAEGPRHETQACPTGALSDRDVRRGIRRLPAASGRRI